MSKIVGHDSRVPQRLRLELAQSLSLIGPADLRSIDTYLTTPARESSGVIETREIENQIKNALMNRLRHSGVDSARQHRLYQRMMNDSDLGDVIQEYAAQHMAGLLLREDCSAQTRREIVNQLFVRAQREKEKRMAGTIILSFNQVCQHPRVLAGEFGGVPVPAPRLLDLCRAIATDPDAFHGNIATAIAVAGEVTARDEALPVPEWVAEVFDEVSTTLQDGSIPGGELIMAAAARALLDSDDESARNQVKEIAVRLGNDTLPGRILESLFEAQSGFTSDPKLP